MHLSLITFIKNSCAILSVLATSLILLLICGLSLAKENEDYAAYAREQQEKAKGLIAPYQAEIQKIIKNVAKRQTEPDIQAFKKEMQSVAKARCPMQALITSQDQKMENEQLPIIIFVSFSMPKASIKGWIREAKLANASVYIRGLVNNSFKDTAQAVGELVNEQGGGLLIDPDLFKKFSIIQVPAVVVVNNNSFDVIYGDVALSYALEKIKAATSPGAQRGLQQVIKKLRSINQHG